MTLLQMELSQLEVEPLDVVSDLPTPQPDADLETLISGKAEADQTGVLMVTGILPSNDGYYCCNSCCTEHTPCDPPPIRGTV